MKIVLFAALLALVAAGVEVQREGNEECAQGGPSYWCKNIITAKQCLAVDYCKERVWMARLKSGSDICTECKQYVGTIHMLIASNSTQAEILVAIKSMCSFMPQAAQGICSEMVDLYGKQLVQQLVEYTADPTSFCTMLGLCSSDTVVLSKPAKMLGRLVRMVQQVKPADDYCTMCEQYVGTIHMFLANNDSQAELLGAVKEACSVLPSTFSGVCSNLVDAYGPQVISMLVDYLADPSQFCSMVGLCPGNVGLKSPRHAFRRPVLNTLKKPTTDYCTMCEQYVGTIHMVLANKETQAEVLSAIKQACSLVPSSMTGVCSELVDTFGQEAISMLVDYIADPSQLCALVQLCPGKAGFKMPPLTFLRRLSLKIKQVQPKKFGDDACAICEQYVGEIRSFLQDNWIQAQLLNTATQLCSYLPSRLSIVCQQLVSTYGRQGISVLVNYLADPSQFCTLVGLCNSDHPMLKSKVFCRLAKMVQEVKPGSDYCTMCEQYVGTIHMVLANKETQAEVLSAIKQACSLAPSSMTGVCNTLVDAFGQQAISMVVNYIADPSQLCSLIGLCSGDKALRMPHLGHGPVIISRDEPQKVGPVKQSTLCVICEFVMAELKNVIGSNATEQEIIDAVDKICTILPTTVQGACQELISEFGPTIIELLLQQLKPSEICTAIRLCTSTKTAIPKDPISCQLCQYAMGYLDSILKDNATVAEIEAAVNSLCSYLPSSISDECKSFVDTYGPYVIELLTEELKPELVCKLIGLCSATNTGKAINPKGAVSCDICTYAMGYLDSILKDGATKAEIEAALSSLCSYLPSSISGECSALIQAFAPEIIDLLVQQLDPSVICKAIGVCSAKSYKTAEVIKKVDRKANDFITCEICQYAMGYLYGIVKDKTVPEIKSALDTLCSKLPSAMSGECTSLVNTYSDEIIQMIMNEISPELICKAIGVCDAKLSKPIPPAKPVDRKANDFITCEICQYAMGYLYGIVKEKTVPEIRSALDTLCSKLPSAMSGECTSLVNTYSDEIIEMIVSELSPELICKHLGICASNEKKVFAAEPRSTFKLGFMRPAAVSCSVCQFAMGYLDSILQDKATQGAIEKAIESLCGYLPDAFKNECDQIVSQYGGNLIDLLVRQELQPNQVCTALKLC